MSSIIYWTDLELTGDILCCHAVTGNTVAAVGVDNTVTLCGLSMLRHCIGYTGLLAGWWHGMTHSLPFVAPPNPHIQHRHPGKSCILLCWHFKCLFSFFPIQSLGCCSLFACDFFCIQVNNMFCESVWRSTHRLTCRLFVEQSSDDLSSHQVSKDFGWTIRLQSLHSGLSVLSALIPLLLC